MPQERCKGAEWDDDRSGSLQGMIGRILPTQTGYARNCTHATIGQVEPLKHLNVA